MNSHAIALIAAKVTFGASMAVGLTLSPHASTVAHAELCTATDAYAREVGDDNCDGMSSPGERWFNTEIPLSHVVGIDSMPVCREEDGSDIALALLPCVWTSSEGDAWLTFADRSVLIFDDTAH
jgi:hypothetical protein